MGCPPIRGDNSRALASGLSYVRWTKMVYLFHTTYISVDIAYALLNIAFGSISLYLISNILEDFENASPYVCTFLANRTCD